MSNATVLFPSLTPVAASSVANLSTQPLLMSGPYNDPCWVIRATSNEVGPNEERYLDAQPPFQPVRRYDDSVLWEIEEAEWRIAVTAALTATSTGINGLVVASGDLIVGQLDGTRVSYIAIETGSEHFLFLDPLSGAYTRNAHTLLGTLRVPAGGWKWEYRVPKVDSGWHPMPSLSRGR